MVDVALGTDYVCNEAPQPRVFEEGDLIGTAEKQINLN